MNMIIINIFKDGTSSVKIPANLLNEPGGRIKSTLSRAEKTGDYNLVNGRVFIHSHEGIELKYDLPYNSCIFIFE